MLVINLLLLIFILLGIIVSLKGDREQFQALDKKEHPLYLLYPLSDLYLSKTGLYKFLYRKDKVKDAIRALNVISRPEGLQRLYWCNRVSLIIFIIAIFNVLSLFGQLSASKNLLVHHGQYLDRPGYGEGSSEAELNITLDKQKSQELASRKSEKDFSKDITVHVEEQAYTEKELKKAFIKSIKYLDACILGKNTSPNKIYENLYFCKNIPGTSIKIEWQPEDYSLVGMDGSVSNNDGIAENGKITTITALLSYQDEQKEYKKTVRIMPRKLSMEENLNRQVKKKLNDSSKETITNEKLKLPDRLNNYQIRWRDKDQNTDIKLFLFGIMIAILIWFVSDKDLENKLSKRRTQMLLDYPDIVNKFTLLINAGMTVKQAWNKICADYEERLKSGKPKRRYAYDEMLVTTHELKLGVTEGEAYEQFGRRAGLLPFMKFSTLIAQNLKKGNSGLCELLNRESMEAFEERKEAAKRLGEEAGTKLLLPMMIMLLIVFIIILVPAFQSFGM